jgi:hypothetical protein
MHPQMSLPLPACGERSRASCERVRGPSAHSSSYELAEAAPHPNPLPVKNGARERSADAEPTCTESTQIMSAYNYRFNFQTATPKCLSRHCERSEAIQLSCLLLHGLLRGACHRARVGATRWLAMTMRYTFAIPRRDAPGVHEFSALKRRGRGECRAPDAPAASCALLVVSMHTSIHSEPPENTRHSRTQWFTAYTVLSPVIGFLATVVTRIAPQT